MSLTTSEILERAADLIEPEGCWAQGYPPEGTFCAATAIGRAARPSMFTRAHLPAMEVLREHLGVEFIVDWNDDDERTQQEVVTALRDAAAAAREREWGAGVSGVDHRPILLVGTFSTRCSICNGGCSPDDVTHDRCIGYGDQPPGCGVLFTHITSVYYSQGIDEMLARRRPDLTLIPIEQTVGGAS